ncbi:MAG: glycosyltransferase family 1 protein [Firmicutes bacterium]|nr:glycosyltransferase family 1 protein [Alicyclobacillaceae bacterium]MCL6497818.1 glycosyltransferase family 1 protein [Bacillota bacterium]
MRIAFVTETWWPSLDGVVTRLTATVRELRRMGHELLIVAPAGGGPEFEGIPVFGVPTVSVRFIYGGKPWGMPLPRVVRLIGRWRPDVVHAVNPFFLGIAAVWAAERHRLPLVASYHTNIATYARFYHLGFFEPLIWAILRALHNRAAVNLATSGMVQEDLVRHRIQRVRLWRRGVDLDQFHPRHRQAAMRARLTGGRPARWIALYVGRLAREKGIERLVHLVQGRSDLHLALVGHGPAEADLRALFRDTPTTFVGPLTGQALAAAYASADFFVFPSTTDTLGLVLLEAMAAGLPLVAADSPPTRELLNGSDAGVLFDAKVPASLTAAVDRLLAQDLRTMGQRARQEAERWGWREPTRELVQFYQLAQTIRL